MNSLTPSQLNESRNAVAVIRALHQKDPKRAQECANLVEDPTAFIAALESMCGAMLRVIDASEPLTGTNGTALLDHLASTMAAE